MTRPPSDALRKAFNAYRKSLSNDDAEVPGAIGRFLYAREGGYLTHPEYTWTDANAIEGTRDRAHEVATLWRVVNNVLVVAQIIDDDGGADVSWLGKASDRESICDAPHWRQPWFAVKRCPNHGALLVVGSAKLCPRCQSPLTPTTKPRALRGPERRRYWEAGGYDRGEGKTLTREFQWARIEQYDYEDSRELAWLRGLSRRDADLAARQEFEATKKRYEDYLNGNWWFVGVWTHFYDVRDIEDWDPDHPDLDALSQEKILADDSIWGIESDYDKDYIVETVEGHVREHLDDVKKRIADRAFFAHPTLPGVG